MNINFITIGGGTEVDPEEGARDPELEEEQEQEEAPVMVCRAGYTLLDDNDADAGGGEASLELWKDN